MLVRRLLFSSVVAVALTGCASGSQVTSLSQPSPAPATSALSATQSGLASTASRLVAPTPTLAPSLPTGSTACGSYGVAATTPAGTEPLLDCAGNAYGGSMILVHVGDQILLSGLRDQAFVSSSPTTVLDVHGSLLTARQSGTATIIVHNWFCEAANGTQPTSCPLAQVTVT